MEVKIGEYKSRPNHVQTATGEIFYYATPEETPIMMKELVEWYNDEADKKHRSFMSHTNPFIKNTRPFHKNTKTFI
jgi:hypothetical protein